MFRQSAGRMVAQDPAKAANFRTAAAAAQRLKIRRIIMTVSVAAITATGAWYGAGLKIKQDSKKVKEQRREATIEEKLDILEEKRTQLITKKMGLERKLSEIEARKAGMSREESRAGQERQRVDPKFKRD